MDQGVGQNLSLVIPCFNEPENIPLLIGQLKEIVSSLPFELEVIIVDGGSDDNTPQILEKEFTSLNSKNFKLILQKERIGYGYDIIAGLKTAKYNILGWTHADMQTDINDVLFGFNLYQSLLKQDNLAKIVVKGDRVGRPLIDTMLTYGMQLFTLLSLKINLYEINAQPKIFSKEFFESALKDNPPHDFSLDLFMLTKAKKNQYNFHSFPVQFNRRELGEAKGGGGSLKNRFNLIKRTAQYILKLKKENSSA